jgi:hypothetical protein
MYFNYSSYNEERVLQKTLQFSLQEAEDERKNQAKSGSKDQQDNQSVSKVKSVKGCKTNVMKKTAFKKALMTQHKMSLLKKKIKHDSSKVKPNKSKSTDSTIKRPVGRPRMVTSSLSVQENKNVKGHPEDTDTEEDDGEPSIEACNDEPIEKKETPIKYKYSATRKFPCNHQKATDKSNATGSNGSVKVNKRSNKSDEPEEPEDICILGNSDVSTSDFLNFLCFRDVTMLALNCKRNQGNHVQLIRFLTVIKVNFFFFVGSKRTVEFDVSD